MMYELTANLEVMLTEAGGELGESGDSAPDRVRAAAALGLAGVEMGRWQTKNIEQLKSALDETGLTLQTMCVLPMGDLTDPSAHDDWLTVLAEHAAAADRLGCPFLVNSGGDERTGVPLQDQHEAIVDALRKADEVLKPYDAILVLENFNTRVDHVGSYLDSATECLDIVDEVSSAHVRVLYDLYHSLVMGERSEVVLDGRVDRVAHVQIADVPGRHEPGTATVDWHHELSTLRDLGYTGRIGLECLPSTSTERALEHIKKVIADLS